MIVSITFKHWFELFWDCGTLRMWRARKDAEQFAGTDRPLRDNWLQLGRDCDSCYTVEEFWWGFFFFLEIWRRIGVSKTLLFARSHWRADARPRAGAQIWGEQLQYVWCAMAGHWVQRELKLSATLKWNWKWQKSIRSDLNCSPFSLESSFHQF